ncbi:hypothetical protein ACFCV3_41925 [Kribbella sp. NPDC056345]|uniref:hypothetical protein n=1 Tax=Kribbella sp. NPDC056345 TaxID=3345789 RepID=UPI0035DACDA2
MARHASNAYAPPDATVAKLIDDISATLRKYLDQGATQTDLVKAACADIVQLRSKFTRDDEIDWQGRSGGFQHAMGEVYSRLNVHDRQRKNLQSKISHYVNIRLREVANPEDLKAAGMSELSPNARIALRRDINAATATALGIQAGSGDSLPRVMGVAAMLTELATNLTDQPISREERAAVKALMSDIRKALTTISKDL